MSRPERTCIGCGARAGKDELVRLRAEEGSVAVDREGKGGRGAWIHPRAACLREAARRRTFARALRQPVRADLELLGGQLTGNARDD